MISTTPAIQLNTIEEAIEDIKAGKVIIVVDDEDRENEGDFICAAEKITPEVINFMATHGRGLICTPVTEQRAKELELNMMVSSNTALHETAFTVSIDLLGQGCSTGISAYDRSTGIKAMTDDKIKASDFARPGHIFPLVAKDGGVLRRTGHTEAAVDLAVLAGLKPAGVLVEILNEDGTMARLPQLVEIGKKLDLKIISIDDLVSYRLEKEQLVEENGRSMINTKYGPLEFISYKQTNGDDSHFVFKMGHWAANDPVLVRVHSADETNDLFDFMFSNKGSRLEKSLQKIAEEGSGALVLMRHTDKEYSIEEQIEDLQKDEEHRRRRDMSQRDFGIGAQILRSLDIQKIRLLTNSPKRRIGLIGYDLEIVENVSF